MIEIVDKNDGQRKLRRSYEDYLPSETQPTQETEIPETSETEPQPTTETPEVTETGEGEKTE